ncbi:MAG: DUF4148 domain-containing protein [Rhodoferax sp.]|uniref:DUF4148 domain-containing protein n=1 Tax=Rhodoferax sp. TaxID=50421 RepID=UPI001400554E|nr:DUF4148 domain-containing protein [Rhodoferax sp.]NDP38068.1 DUF4148 domain-containing protein [Rhodoferax sp.]
MKNRFATIALILASGLIAGTPALAEYSRTDDNIGFGNFSNQQIGSSVTREQVTAELMRAHRTGEHQSVRMMGRDDDGEIQASSPEPSSVTRKQVTAELMRAHRTGEHQSVRMMGRDDDGTLPKL